MKKSFKLFSLILLAAATAFAACTKQPQEKPTDQSKDPTTVSDDPGSSTDPVYADLPFSKVSVTCAGETVDGTLLPDGKTINFRFNKAESFNDATLAVEVNEGYTLTYPTTLEHVDLQAEPVLNFKTPTNATVKFWLTFSSDAFPIVDETKIHLAGEGVDGLLKIDQGTKTFTVTYDKEKLDYEAVTFVFEDGALQEGATVKTALTYDFTDGLSQPLVIDLGGERAYTVVLDVTAYIQKTPAEFGFQDETFKYVDNVENYPYLHVYRTSRVTGVPVYSTTEWAHFNPYEWDTGWAYDENSEWGGYQYGWVDEFFFLGDWAEDRLTMDCIGPLVLVTLDRGEYFGEIVTNEDYSLMLGDVEGFVTVPGYSDNKDNWNYLLYADQKVRVPLNGDGEIDVLYRSALGFDDEGKPQFANVYADKDATSVKQVPFQSGHSASQEDVAATAVDWDVVSAAWALPWIIRDGVAMSWMDLWNNDASRWAAAFGQAWQTTYPCHVCMGVTYDNQIAFMVTPGGSDNWDGADTNNCPDVFTDGGWFKGISTNQMAWIAKQLGWKEFIVVCGQNGENTGNASTIRVNGKSVFAPEDHPYGAVNGAAYADEAAEVNCAYVMKFDER